MKNTLSIELKKGDKVTKILGEIFVFHSHDKSLTIYPKGKKLTFGELNAIKNAVKGTNRIHLPLAYLFWVDCKNGKHSNWKLI